MIINVPFIKTELLQKELDAIKDNYEGQNQQEYLVDFFKQFPTVESYVESFSRVEKVEFLRYAKALGNSARILDMGSGRGETCIYLANQGHKVSAIEPSLANCEFIEYAANFYNLNITIYLCNAESLDKINDKFDIIIFNSSLHHCDDPLLALKNCYQVLADGGTLLIANEPVLPFFRTKKWFLKRLSDNPGEMGNYGGNEHIYYYSEYENMIKRAGFKKIKSMLNIKYTDYNLAVQYLTDYEERIRNFAKGIKQLDPAWDTRTKRRRFYKLIYFYIVHILYKSGIIGLPFLGLLKRLSLLQISFVARKQEA